MAKKKLYYSFLSSDGFGGFALAEEMPDDTNYSVHGPFLSLREAKQDAKDYFDCDISRAKQAKREISQFKIKDWKIEN